MHNEALASNLDRNADEIDTMMAKIEELRLNNLCKLLQNRLESRKHESIMNIKLFSIIS